MTMKKKNMKEPKPTSQSSNTDRELSVKRDPWGCMAGTVIFMPNVDLTAPSDEVWNAKVDQATKQS
jgi:hypothetical protein